MGSRGAFQFAGLADGIGGSAEIRSMDIKEVIDKIKNTSNCMVCSPCGLPSLEEDVELPDDIKIFYKNCGGVSLFPNEEYGFTIVGPDEMVQANPVIAGEPCKEVTDFESI